MDLVNFAGFAGEGGDYLQEGRGRVGEGEGRGSEGQKMGGFRCGFHFPIKLY